MQHRNHLRVQWCNVAIQHLVGFAITILVLILEHGEVGLVAALRDVMVFDGFQDGTARLVGVGAVAEAAVLGEVENLLEVACQFLALHVEGAKTLNARRINEIGSRTGKSGLSGISGQWNPLREGGGVLTRLVGLADVGRTQVGTWHEAVDECRLAHAAVATEQRYLAAEQGAQLVDASACLC